MLRDLITTGTRWTLVGGKGGVGKTTTAAALALELAAEGEPVLVLSVDPAHSLGDALGVELTNEPLPIPAAPALEALEVDAAHERARFLDSNRGHLLRLIERGTYLDLADASGFVELALPGMDELAALLRLLDLAESDRRVVIDTAPTGHTLRLLELPTLARGWLAALQAMEAKHQTVTSALVGVARPDEATEMLDRVADELARLDALLRDPRRCRFLLVSTPEPVVLAETRRFQEALTERGVALGGIVVNRAGPGAAPGATGSGMVFVPGLEADPQGLAGLAAFSRAATAAIPAAPPAAASGERIALGGAFEPPLDRTLHLVGGKGGVGKSTAACALALRLTRALDRPVLLLGADPAGSLADVLGTPVGAGAREHPGVPGLHVRELDAARVWADFRDEYRAEAERLFGGLMGGMSASADRAVVERLIDLAPPGIDELIALLEMVDRLEEGRYAALVLDTAPTGHLLRLLEMPQVALDWTHALMRLLLKYREVMGLGGLAERVLKLSRSLRDLLALLRDPARCWLLVVALPQALAVPETRRLLAAVRAMGISPGALLVNRAEVEGDSLLPGGETRRLLAEAEGLPTYAAPALAAGPVGPAALEDFLSTWREVPAVR